MLNIELYFLYRTTFLPSKAVFYGVHKTADFNFGTGEFKDPFVGSGAKIRALCDAGARRKDFLVENLLIGTEHDCYTRLNSILSKIRDYDHPLCLNTRDGAKAGVPKSEAHKKAIAKATAVAMEGNTNALGTTANQTSILDPEVLEVLEDIKTIGKLKWFNNGVQSKMIAVNENNQPIKEEYADWVLGQLKKPKTTE